MSTEHTPDNDPIPKRLKMIELQTELIRGGQLTTCTNCEHWTKEETCALYGMRPPAPVIVVGCQNHVLTIPF